MDCNRQREYEADYMWAFLEGTDEEWEGVAAPVEERPEKIIPLLPDADALELVDKTQLTPFSTVLLPDEEFFEKITNLLKMKPKKKILKVKHQNCPISLGEVIEDDNEKYEAVEDNTLSDDFILRGTAGDVCLDFRHFRKNYEGTRNEAQGYLLKHHFKVEKEAKKPYVNTWLESEAKRRLASFEKDPEIVKKLRLLRQTDDKPTKKRQKKNDDDVVPKKKRTKEREIIETYSESSVSDKVSNHSAIVLAPFSRTKSHFSSKMTEHENRTKKRMKSPPRPEWTDDGSDNSASE